MTHDETKILHWSSPHSRMSGIPWSGELDVEEITTDTMTFDQGSLACALVHGHILQVTSAAVYLHPDITLPCTEDERIIHASIWEDNLVVVLHTSNTKHFRLTHIVFSQTDSPRIFSIDLIDEPSIVKIFPYPYVLLPPKLNIRNLHDPQNP